VACGGKRIEGAGNFVQPTIIESNRGMPSEWECSLLSWLLASSHFGTVVQQEVFVPILHVMKFKV
jgi:acyl-CoA reductase-like NAD-dependent aldehyde dehydrogenase